MSEDFTEFTRRVARLSDSLTEIIYYESRIMELLVEYIQRENSVALEPLLDLISHFAHDLGLRFEKHFHQAVSLVAKLASRHVDIEVIEWSFNCLAWLFKYLSRLLTPDLRPLYDLMAPLLGKERQKPFITRFAAEAMSFLLRKAGALHHKTESPLSTIVGYILKDLADASHREGSDLYEHGLMTLFAESIRGVKDALHSSGPAVFEELLRQTLETNEHDPQTACSGLRVVEGVLIATLHHSSTQNFQPIQDAIIKHARIAPPHLKMDRLMVMSRILLVLAAVKGGSCISDWPSVMEHAIAHISLIASQGPAQNMAAATNALTTLAVTHQNCPLNVAISTSKFLGSLWEEPWLRLFPGFCLYYAELGKERFRDFLLPHFKKFVAANWRDLGQESLACTLQLVQSSLLSKTSVTVPAEWQDHMLTELDVVLDLNVCLTTVDEARLAKCSAFLELTKDVEGTSGFAVSASHRIAKAWEQTFSKQTTPRVTKAHDFVAGNAFYYAVTHGGVDAVKTEVWWGFCDTVPLFESLPTFWTSFNEMLRRRPGLFKESEQVPEVDLLVNSLLDCLASPSHQLRLTCLEILQLLIEIRDETPAPIIDIAISVEKTTPTLETMRSLSMQIRRLASEYKKVSRVPWIDRAVPAWCFGLLHVKFSQLWDDSCAALREMCATKEGEDIICDMAFRWLEGLTAAPTSPVSDKGSADAKLPKAITEFESANLMNVLRLATEAETSVSASEGFLLDLFSRKHARVALKTDFSRTQSLRFLKMVPHVAEKRSRLLVPVLLSWALDESPESAHEEGRSPSSMVEDTSPLTAVVTKRPEGNALALFAIHKPEGPLQICAGVLRFPRSSNAWRC